MSLARIDIPPVKKNQTQLMVPQQRIRLEATEDKQKGKWDILE